uniref:Uncharacterized protein n=1 Tax=Setaria italica TaxID=4555 RepID=K3YA03_SETIT
MDRAEHSDHRSVLDVDVVLDGGVAGLEVEGVRARLRVPSRHPEHAGAPDDGHLPDGVEHGVPAHDGDGAAVVFAGLEDEVHVHHQGHLVLAGGDVGALRAAEGLGGLEVGALGERVVDDHDGAEARLGSVGDGGVRHLHRRRARPAHHVVPVELDVRLLLAAARRRRRGGGGGQEERQEEEGNGGGHGARLAYVAGGCGPCGLCGVAMEFTGA